MKKAAFYLRITFIAILFLLLSVSKIKTMIPLETYILSVSCVFISFFFGPTLFLITNIPLLVLEVVDFHLRRMYQLSIFDAAPWISMLILDTNKDEIQEYLLRLNIFEYATMVFIFISIIFARFYRPDKKIPKSVYLVFWLSFPLSQISCIYPTIAFFSDHSEKETLNAIKNFKFNPSISDKAAHNVIVIIGETHRYDEFQSSFQKYEKDFSSLYNFKDVISNYANTMNAVPTILSRKKFTDKSGYFSEKSLFSLFKEAGYDTYFLHYTNTSNITERNKLSFIYNDAQNFINFASPDDNLHDIRIFNELNKILTTNKRKKLIVVKMIGVHIDFQYRYPMTYDVRKPSLKQPDEGSRFWSKIKSVFKLSPPAVVLPENKEAALNTYKNAMDYSVEIIDSLFGLAKKQPEATLTMFSSDHGICLFEKGHFQLPPDCREAFHVPVLFHLNQSLRKSSDSQKLKQLSCNSDKPLTQEYLFETLISLAGISYPTADKKYDLTNRCNPLTSKRSVDISQKMMFYEDL